MDLKEVAPKALHTSAASNAVAIAHVCIVQAHGARTALGKEYVATDDDVPFTSETAALDAINNGLRQVDSTLASPWRQLRAHECEFCHPKQHVAAAIPVADLYALEELLAALQTAPERNLALARGTLKPAAGTNTLPLVTSTHRGGDLELFDGRLISAGQLANFDDIPSRLLLLDLDGLKDAGLDLFTASAGDVDDTLRSIVDGIPTLAGASFVFQPTSSFGLVDRDKLSGRLAFITDWAVTLEEEQILTDHLNREAGKTLFDTRICAVGHLIYTSLPALYADIAGQDRVRLHFDAAHRDRLLARVVEGDRDTIAVPVLDAGLLRETRALRAAAVRRSGGEWTKGWAGRNIRPLAWRTDIAPLLAEISSTGAYDQMLRAVMRIALRAPSHRFKGLLARLAAEARVRIMDTSTGGDLKRRLGYTDPDRLARELETALAKAGRRRKRVALPRAETPISLSEGRGCVANALDAAVNAHGTVLDEWRRACGKAKRAKVAKPERPTLPTVVVKAPPGLGKTHASNETQDPMRAANGHMLHLTPTIDLAKQKERDYQARWGKTNSRRVKSRAELCIDPGDWGRRCDDLERRGMSPKPVCDLCPFKKQCPAPARERDFEHGLTIGTHQQAFALFGDQWLNRGEIHKKRKAQPEHVFWDETAVPALLGEPARFDVNSAALDTSARRDIAAAVHASKAEVATSLVAGRGIVGWAWATTAEARRREAAEQTIASIVTGMCGAKPKRRNQAAKAKLAADQAVLDKAKAERDAAAFFEVASRACLLALINCRQFVFGLDADGSEGIAQLPKRLPEMCRQAGTYVLDATSVPELDRALLGPDTIFYTVPPVKAGAVRVEQFCDRSYGQSFFPDAASSDVTDGDGDDDADAGAEPPAKGAPKLKRRDSSIARLHAFIWHVAAGLFAEQRAHGCVVEGRKIDVAVMCQPAVRRQLIERGLPPNVYVTTHKLARGLNFAEEAPCVITVGRTMPAADELLRQARVIAAGLPASDADLQLTLNASNFEPVTLPCADGAGVEVKKRRHMHPLVQALDEYYESDVIQSAFRGRPLSRSALNPLRLIVFGNVATGLPIDEPLEWIDAARSELDIQQALGVVCERAVVGGPARKIPLSAPSPHKRSNARAYVDSGRRDGFFASQASSPVNKSTARARFDAAEAWAKHLAETAADAHWRIGCCSVPGNRCKQRVSIDTSRHADPQAAVQLAFGAGAVWKGWEGEAAPKRPRGRPRKAAPTG